MSFKRTRRVQVLLSDNGYTILRRICEKEGRSMNDVLRDAFYRYAYEAGYLNPPIR
ncbi:MAG: hypothetical protein QXP58_06935 [Thermoprotei archaeon]